VKPGDLIDQPVTLVPKTSTRCRFIADFGEIPVPAADESVAIQTTNGEARRRIPRFLAGL
jgi:hypothetical protein